MKVDYAALAKDFTDTPYDSKEEKKRAFYAITRFLAAGCPPEKFTKQVYHHLNLHMFGHIAHYNAGGFYDAWFSTPQARARWVEYAMRGGVYGFHPLSRTDCWGDVERAIVAWLKASGVGQRLRKAAHNDTESCERATLAALKAKYEPDTVA